MRKSRKFISMPIISIEEGQQIGTVKSIVLDPEKKELAALIIEQRGWFKDQKVIPYIKVHSVGGDAITVEKYTNAEKQTNLPNIVKLIKEKYEIIGAKVVAENGTVLGYVDEFYVDLTNGKITTLEISGRFFDGLLQGKATLGMEYIKTVGKEVLVAVAGAEEQLKQIELGLKGTFNNLKSTSSNLWDSTVQKTKAVTKTINQSFEKKKASKPPEDQSEANILNLDNANDLVESNLSQEDVILEEQREENSDKDIESDTVTLDNIVDTISTDSDEEAAEPQEQTAIVEPIDVVDELENIEKAEDNSQDTNESVDNTNEKL